MTDVADVDEGTPLTPAELMGFINDLRDEVAEMRTVINVEQQARIAAEVKLSEVVNYLDMQYWVPVMSAGNISSEVINLRVEVDAFEKRFFGKEIDAMAAI